jgi:hypothetical protein
MMKWHLLPGLIGVGVAGVIGLGLGVWPAGGSGSGLTASGTLAASRARAPVTCGMFEQPMGYVGLLRAGQAAASSHALGARLLTQVSDRANGTTTDLVRSAAGLRAAQRAQFFSRWLPVYPQAREGWLRSCDMTLSDRPAAQSLINAAVTAFVRAGYFRSAAAARSLWPQVLVSDDPTAPRSVIVTYAVLGPVTSPTVPAGSKAGPHPPLHGLDVYTAIVKVAGAAVTGVAKGGF